MSLDLKGSLFYTPTEIATMFGKPMGWVYKRARGSGFLAPHARKFDSRTLLFVRTGIDRLIAEGPPKESKADAEAEGTPPNSQLHSRADAIRSYVATGWRSSVNANRRRTR